MPDQDIAFAHESAATPETAGRMARATLGFTVTRTRLRVCALAYVVNVHSFRRTVPPGTVQRTGFGRDEFVTANALSSSRFSYRAVHSVDAHGGFVFIRYVGSPVMRVYPRELFPPAAMNRLREAAGRGSAASRP